MDTLMLSRLQFAFATFIHFIFVPLTLGLSVIVAIMETKFVRTGDETYKKMAKFWGKLFLINFALGVVTGITLEFQFGTNWSRYSTYVGDIFGSLLAIEATAAFFLESTFIAVWVFGWKKLSPKLHATAIWLVAIASNLSAVWIILANGFMQHPVGYVIRNGRAELSNFIEVITNGYAWGQFLHTVTGAMALAGFFVVGISAWHLLRRQSVDFFTKSFRIGAAFALIFSVVVALVGHTQGNTVAALQPAKLAAMESHWETAKNAPMYLFAIPDAEKEGNSVPVRPHSEHPEPDGLQRPLGRGQGPQGHPQGGPAARGTDLRVLPPHGGPGHGHDRAGHPGLHHAPQARGIGALGAQAAGPGHPPCPIWACRPAGPWPRWAASPGSSTGSCAPRTRSRPSPPPRWPSAWQPSSWSISCWRAWTSTFWPSTPASSRPRPDPVNGAV